MESSVFAQGVRKSVLNGVALLLPALCAPLAQGQDVHAKNVILFVGDGAGLSSLNAASIYGYNNAAWLFVESMPHLALADTSTSDHWVTDGAAAATAMARGYKTQLGTIGSPSADSSHAGVKGESILEYAGEHGLSTGLITDGPALGGITAPFFAQVPDRRQSADIFGQLVHPRFGKGVNLLVGTHGNELLTTLNGKGINGAAALKAVGYEVLSSSTQLSTGTNATNVAVLSNEDHFEMPALVADAIRMLSHNPKGFFLVVHSDCHVPNVTQDLACLVSLDKAVKLAADLAGSETLILFTADHAFGIQLIGEDKPETAKGKDVIPAIKLLDEHTAEQVPVLAMGPGSDAVHGFMSNSDIFAVMMNAYGWKASGH